jgi:maltooligosyltrehalose trehalohydrolase
MEITFYVYAKDFFTDRHQTPWGAAINFLGSSSRPVRDFFIYKMLYGPEEYHFDGLRLDAVHAIADDFNPDIRIELDSAIHQGSGKERLIHLIRERHQRGTLSCP